MDKSKEIFSEYSDIVTVDEVMKMLRLGKNTVYKLLKDDEIMNVKVGARYIIRNRASSNLYQPQIANLKKGRLTLEGSLIIKRQLLLCQISCQRQTENDCHEDTS